jgi:hypothetical protein
VAALCVIKASQGAVVSPVSWSACDGMPSLDNNLADTWRSNQPAACLPMVSGAHSLSHDIQPQGLLDQATLHDVLCMLQQVRLPSTLRAAAKHAEQEFGSLCTSTRGHAAGGGVLRAWLAARKSLALALCRGRTHA